MNKEESGRSLKVVGVKPQLTFSGSSAQCLWQLRSRVVARIQLLLWQDSAIYRASFRVETERILRPSVSFLIHFFSLYKRTLCLNDDTKVTIKL